MAWISCTGTEVCQRTSVTVACTDLVGIVSSPTMTAMAMQQTTRNPTIPSIISQFVFFAFGCVPVPAVGTARAADAPGSGDPQLEQTVLLPAFSFPQWG